MLDLILGANRVVLAKFLVQCNCLTPTWNSKTNVFPLCCIIMYILSLWPCNFRWIYFALIQWPQCPLQHSWPAETNLCRSPCFELRLPSWPNEWLQWVDRRSNFNHPRIIVLLHLSHSASNRKYANYTLILSCYTNKIYRCRIERN